MPKRFNSDDEDEKYIDDQLYLSSIGDLNSYVLYKNGQIIVEKNEHEIVPVVIKDFDYIIAKIWIRLQNHCSNEALPLLDKKGSNSFSLLELLKEKQCF